jgi:hypothetical protein
MASLSDVFGGGDLGTNGATMQMQNPQNPQNTKPQQPQISYPNNVRQDEQQNNETAESKTEKVINDLEKKMEQQKKLKKIKEEFKLMKNENTSIVDKYIRKSKEMWKLFLLVLLAVCALILADLFKLYTNKYIQSNDFSSNKEKTIRFSVPLTIFFLIWTFKAFSKD